MKIKKLTPVDEKFRDFYEETKPDILEMWEKINEIIDVLPPQGDCNECFFEGGEHSFECSKYKHKDWGEKKVNDDCVYD